MSKKHFIALADRIIRFNQFSKTTQDQPFTPLQISMLADFCKTQNQNFDRQRWLGYINGTNGPSGGKI